MSILLRPATLQDVPFVVWTFSPAAQRLYEPLGFRHSHDINAFGESYRKMMMEI